MTSELDPAETVRAMRYTRELIDSFQIKRVALCRECREPTSDCDGRIETVEE